MIRKTLVIAAAATFAASGAGIAVAANGGGNAQQPTGVHAKHAKAAAFVACDGGAQKQVKNRIGNTPFTYGETGGNVAIPGTALKIGGPRAGRDTLVITFSGETQLTGSTGTQDWQGLEIHVDGVPINPYTASGDVMALNGSPTWDLHSGTFCTKIGPGTHTVEAFTNLADFDTDDTLGGWIDDYTLSVERSE